MNKEINNIKTFLYLFNLVKIKDKIQIVINSYDYYYKREKYIEVVFTSFIYILKNNNYKEKISEVNYQYTDTISRGIGEDIKRNRERYSSKLKVGICKEVSKGIFNEYKNIKEIKEYIVFLVLENLNSKKLMESFERGRQIIIYEIKIEEKDLII